jgi:hypothetical protein
MSFEARLSALAHAIQHAEKVGVSEVESIVANAEKFFGFLNAATPVAQAATPVAQAATPVAQAATPVAQAATPVVATTFDIEAWKKTQEYTDASAAFLAMAKAKGREFAASLLNGIKAGATKLSDVGPELLAEAVKQCKAAVS